MAEQAQEQASDLNDLTHPEEEVEETQSQEAEAQTEEAQEEKAESKETESTEEQSSEEFTPWKLKVDNEEVEVKTKEELQELAQKGFHYTKKMQVFAEAEKQRAQQQQFIDQLSANPKVFEMLVAQNLGADPSLVSRTPTPPLEAWKDIDPVGYGRAVAQYEYELKQKQLIEQTVPLVIRGNVDASNNVLFQKALITHELNDNQLKEVRQFVESTMRPNQLGMFSDSQVAIAVRELYGKEKAAAEKLKESENFNTKLKNLSKSASGKTVSQRSPKEKESAESPFLRFVEETSEGG